VAACLIFSQDIKMAKNQSMISGTVCDPKGQPVAEARVYFIEAPVSLPDVAALTDDSGKFSLTAPAAGTYRIGCSADGFAPITITVKVTNNQDVQVEIKLKK
jgi:hypothetical protein